LREGGQERHRSLMIARPICIVAAIQKRTYALPQSTTVPVSPLMSAAWGRAPTLPQSILLVEGRSGKRSVR
jgi:hypothetical protein